MSRIDNETLIFAIKKRPALYNKKDPNYNQHKYKTKLWIQVCREVYSNYNKWSPERKLYIAQEVKRKWNSLRTSFTRELKYQRKERQMMEAEEPIRKRKVYEHFMKMSFLLDNTNAADDAPNTSNFAEESGHTNESDDTNVGNSTNLEIEPDISSLVQVDQRRNENLEDKILDMLMKQEKDEIRQFLLSLVPSFRKLQQKEMLQAKMEILGVLLKFERE